MSFIKFIMLSVIILNNVMLSVGILNVVMLSVVMQSVVILSVVLLRVWARRKPNYDFKDFAKSFENTSNGFLR